METHPIEGDLGFVKGLLEKSEERRSPKVIYFLWAVIVLVGFSLVDFESKRAGIPWVGIYWMIVAPIGAVASGFLGWRESRRLGQVDTAVGWRHSMHWAGMMGAIFLLVLLRIKGALGEAVLGQAILVVIAFGYFLAGVHLERPLLWIGLLMAAGYIAMLFVSGFTWTIAGGIIAVGMIAAAFTGGKRRDPSVS